uniref:COMM domain containing 8 n=1 Tax=Pundamilia nyererei TaxID=303518 RepID=A0A3B4FRU1_9CICH
SCGNSFKLPQSAVHSSCVKRLHRGIDTRPTTRESVSVQQLRGLQLFVATVMNGQSPRVRSRLYLKNRHFSPAVVLSVLRAREEEIRCALLDRTNSISSATLQDFDWQLKLALSSDKISSLHTPLLSLSLDVRENGVLQPVTLEMNRDELGMLISSLESANKVVLQLK